jgi:hypothetical protein
MRSNSASEPQSGFSHNTQAPASIAATLMDMCCAGGVAIRTMSGLLLGQHGREVGVVAGNAVLAGEITDALGIDIDGGDEGDTALGGFDGPHMGVADGAGANEDGAVDFLGRRHNIKAWERVDAENVCKTGGKYARSATRIILKINENYPAEGWALARGMCPPCAGGLIQTCSRADSAPAPTRLITPDYPAQATPASCRILFPVRRRSGGSACGVRPPWILAISAKRACVARTNSSAGRVSPHSFMISGSQRCP